MIIFLIVVFAVIIVLIIAVFSVTSDGPIGRWVSLEGQEEYNYAYNLAMKSMPEPTQVYNVLTSFGTVRVYKWGSEDKIDIGKPIVLLPGRSSGVPMWYLNINDFVNSRIVYAFDALGDAGMSVQTSPIKNSEEQALWINEVLTELRLTKIHAVGHSFGGWLVANYASMYPERIESISLIEPVFTFQSIKPILIIKSIPYNLKFLPKSWRQGLIKEISGTDNIDRLDPVARMIDDGTTNYIMKLPIPKQITKEQMQNWTFPVFLALAGKSPIHDSNKAIQVAKTNVKNLTGKVWEYGTHSLPMEYSKLIDEAIIDFIDEAELK
ncbi:MAG: alpha/beta hydrolase [Methanobacterium sp.]|nr:alpha/beta hydrolase [Methanobacterium sp.]